MQYKTFLAACLAAALSVTNSSAQKGRYQSEETIILKQESPQTVIEIRDGNVYINGDKMAAVRDGSTDNIRKKIIIEHGVQQGTRPRSDRTLQDDRETPHRAVLGVITNTRDQQDGALIVRVSEGSPADEAGLKAGDRITELDGKAIKNAAMLTEEIGSRRRPGDEVNIVYERNGKIRTTTARLDEAGPAFGNNNRVPFSEDFSNNRMPGNSFFRDFRFPEGDGFAIDDDRPKIGVSVEDREDERGVLVARVLPGSAAAKAGIRAGDVLMKADDETIASAAQLQDIIGGKKPGDRVKLAYKRNGASAIVDVQLPKRASKADL